MMISFVLLRGRSNNASQIRKAPVFLKGEKVRIASKTMDEYRKNPLKKVVDTWSREIYYIRRVIPPKDNIVFSNVLYLVSDGSTYDGFKLQRVNEQLLIRNPSPPVVNRQPVPIVNRQPVPVANRQPPPIVNRQPVQPVFQFQLPSRPVTRSRSNIPVIPGASRYQIFSAIDPKLKYGEKKRA